MKKNSSLVLHQIHVAIFFISLLLTTPFFVNAQAKNIHSDSSNKNTISEEKFVVINGIEQWVTIKGEKAKPIILFIHGGPGSPISPYIDVLFSDLKKDFSSVSIAI